MRYLERQVIHTMNKEKDKEHCNLENQCDALIKIVSKLNREDVKRITDVATGIALVRDIDVLKKLGSKT